MTINIKNQVSKSKDLLKLKDFANVNISLQEFKILDIYLSRINPQDLTSAKVVFTKDEYCEIMNISSNKVRPEQLEKYTSNLLSSQLRITLDAKGKGSYRQINIFSSCEYFKDDDLIIIECNHTNDMIKRLFFDIENFRYIKYNLENTVYLKSLHSFNLYMYLLDNKFKGEWKISIDDLKDELKCNIDYYKQFKRFHDDVLKKAVKEINEKTNIRFDYDKVKNGRNVIAIKFAYMNNKSDQQSLFDSENISNDIIDVDYHEENGLPNNIRNDFNREEGDYLDYEYYYFNCLDYIENIEKPDIRLVVELANDVGEVVYEKSLLDKRSELYYIDDMEVTKKYINRKILEMKSRKNIKYKYSYLKKMIKADLKAEREES